MEPTVWDVQHQVVRTAHSGRPVSPNEIFGIEMPYGLRGFLQRVRKSTKQDLNPPMQVMTTLGIHQALKGLFRLFFRNFNELVYYYPVFVFENEIELAHWLADPERLHQAKLHHKMKRGAVHPVRTLKCPSQN